MCSRLAAHSWPFDPVERGLRSGCTATALWAHTLSRPSSNVLTWWRPTVHCGVLQDECEGSHRVAAAPWHNQHPPDPLQPVQCEAALRKAPFHLSLQSDVSYFTFWSVTTSFLASFQGFFAALFYCFCNKEVQKVVSDQHRSYDWCGWEPCSAQCSEGTAGAPLDPGPDVSAADPARAARPLRVCPHRAGQTLIQTVSAARHQPDQLASPGPGARLEDGSGRAGARTAASRPALTCGARAAAVWTCAASPRWRRRGSRPVSPGRTRSGSSERPPASY